MAKQGKSKNKPVEAPRVVVADKKSKKGKAPNSEPLQVVAERILPNELPGNLVGVSASAASVTDAKADKKAAKKAKKAKFGEYADQATPDALTPEYEEQAEAQAAADPVPQATPAMADEIPAVEDRIDPESGDWAISGMTNYVHEILERTRRGAATDAEVEQAIEELGGGKKAKKGKKAKAELDIRPIAAEVAAEEAAAKDDGKLVNPSINPPAPVRRTRQTGPGKYFAEFKAAQDQADAKGKAKGVEHTVSQSFIAKNTGVRLAKEYNEKHPDIFNIEALPDTFETTGPDDNKGYWVVKLKFLPHG